MIDRIVVVAGDPQTAVVIEEAIKVLEVTAAGGTPSWGSITGTLSAQADLQTALDAKADDAQAVPPGGTTGQLLAKASNADHHLTWSTAPGAPTWGGITGTLSAQADLQNAINGRAPAAAGMPVGGTAGQILTKVSGTDHHVTWTTGPGAPTWGGITGTLSAQTDLQTALNGRAPAAAGVPLGGTTGQVLAKASNTDHHLMWSSAGGAPVWGGITGTLSAQTDLQAALDAKADAQSRRRTVYIESDFLLSGVNAVPHLLGAAVSAGTTAAVAGQLHHPGIVSFSDSTTANGGYRYFSELNALLIAGGERCFFTFQSRGARATASTRMGFQDSNVINTAPVDGAWLEITGDGTVSSIRGRCRNNNVQTETTTFALTLNTWFTAMIEVNANATSVAFTLFNAAGTQVWQQSITTNIPTAVGRETGFGIISGETSTDAAAVILWLDYIYVDIHRTLTR